MSTYQKLHQQQSSQVSRYGVTYSNPASKCRVVAREIASAFNGHSNATVNGLPIRPTIHGTRAQKRQGVIFGTSIVYGDVPEHVVTDLLGQVNVDAQEVGCQTIS